MDKVERIHFSVVPMGKLRKPDHYGTTTHDQMKPHGFWYSIGDAWQEWCATEMTSRIAHYRYAVDVPRANLLVLDSPEKVRKLTADYSVELMPNRPELRIRKMDWGRLSADYDALR